MNHSYKHIFFDLDRTLWDFEKNSHKELISIFKRNKLHQQGISLEEEFIKVYKKINEECWELYRDNNITKEKLRSERFNKTLHYFGVNDDKLSKKIADQYIENSPKRTILIDGTFELLDYLQGKYKMHIITNGFEEVQFDKLKNSGLLNYFDHVITSEAAGQKKPHPFIFQYALDLCNARVNESIMIGDDLKTDIKGAVDFGMPCIYFNPHNVKHDLSLMADVPNLLSIKSIL